MREKKILIIDDEKEFAEMVKLNLEGSGGYQVMVEIKGKRGLSTAENFKPDLILLDIRMPDKDGLELLKDFKKHPKLMSTPVIMLTAIETEQTKAEAIHQFSEDYLTKPVTDMELKGKMKEVLKKFRGGSLPAEDFVVTKKAKETRSTKHHRAKLQKSKTRKDYKSTGVTVLIADDEKADCDLIEALLIPRGFEVYSCSNPLQVMAQISKIKPDILILDLVMPKMDGVQILKKVKELKIKIKIIIVTGLKDPLIIKDAITLGADDVIVKPFSIEQMHATLLKHVSSIDKG